MTDFFDILTENGIDVPEEKKKAVKTEVLKNYKTINEYENKVNGLNDELNTAKGTITDLNNSIETLKQSGANVDELQKQIDAYKQADADRQKAEAEAKITADLKARFLPLKGDKKFINEYTENGTFNEFRKALSDEAFKGKSDAEIYEAITKDKAIYTNPNGLIDIPPVGGDTEPKTKFKRFF